MDTWVTGTRLGPYELVSLIGSGGMGEVWKARDTRLGRTVAIKRLKTEHADRFAKEARTIAALNHPNICQLYDIGPDYLVMEYIDGKPVHGRRSAEEALRLAVQIAGALEEAHRAGIIHRDLKPGNIMVTAGGVAKLLDFGLAKLTATTDPDATGTMEGTVMGTAAYMAPEQVEGKPLNERSDVFSFGAVLYEMLSGRRAFEGSSTAQVLSAVLRDDPPALEASEGLRRIVMRCLAKRPLDRFLNMSEVKAALEGLFGKAAASEPSIAVLPFADMSPEKDNEYFSDGLAEEIINALAQIPGLKVIARTSAFSFKGQHTDIRRIAEALGVTSILEGSVRKAGNRIRVTAQLITAADGSQLWSQRYDRELTDVFAIQDEIAQAIAQALEVKLSPASTATPRRHTPNLPAYEAFLKGRHHWSKLTPDSFQKSREFYEQAIALDPQFALAHTFLGEHFFALAINGLRPAAEVMPQVRVHARKALDIDPSLGEAHALLALVAATYDYDWDEVERQFRQAMAAEPVPPYARTMYGAFCLRHIGQFARAVEESELALREDPLNLLWRIHLAMCLDTAGRTEEAVQQLHKILEIDESYYLAYAELCCIEAVRGDAARALRYAERASVLAPWFFGRTSLAGLLARQGDGSAAESMMAPFEDRETYGSPMAWVLFYLVQADIEKAAEWMEEAITQRDPRVLVFLSQFFRPSSRWPRLSRMVNLPEQI